jgi:hypothetical protein
MVEDKEAENETIELLKEISSKLSDINDRTEDRRFQLNFAKFQTYFELLITFYFGTIASLITFSIYAGGMYNTLPDSNSMKPSYGAANALALLLLFPITIFFAVMLFRTRKAMDKLLEQQ